MLTLTLSLLFSAFSVQIPQRRIGLGVQYSTMEIFSPDQGFLQAAKLNATAIEAEIDRFLKDGKKPPIHREIRPDIVGLQGVKGEKGDKSEDLPINEAGNPLEIPSEVPILPSITPETPSIPLYTDHFPTELPEFLPEAYTTEEVSSERNSSSFMLLCMLGVGLVLTLGGLYYKNTVAF